MRQAAGETTDRPPPDRTHRAAATTATTDDRRPTDRPHTQANKQASKNNHGQSMQPPRRVALRKLLY